MAATTTTWNASEVLETYFLETRAKLIEVAANLDRVDRAGGVDPGDARLMFIREAMEILRTRGPHRAERIQKLYSKP